MFYLVTTETGQKILPSVKVIWIFFYFIFTIIGNTLMKMYVRSSLKLFNSGSASVTKQNVNVHFQRKHIAKL